VAQRRTASWVIKEWKWVVQMTWKGRRKVRVVPHPKRIIYIGRGNCMSVSELTEIETAFSNQVREWKFWEGRICFWAKKKKKGDGELVMQKKSAVGGGGGLGWSFVETPKSESARKWRKLSSLPPGNYSLPEPNTVLCWMEFCLSLSFCTFSNAIMLLTQNTYQPRSLRVRERFAKIYCEFYFYVQRIILLLLLTTL
jgi:hypothetical protein